MHGRIISLAALLLFATTGAQADHFEEDVYYEYLLYDFQVTHFDVLIVPAATKDSAYDTYLMEASVDAWIAGIQGSDVPWLADGLTIDRYTLSQDDIPDEVLVDPEIVIIGAEANPALLFGIGHDKCFKPYGYAGPGHQHEGSAWKTIFSDDRCTGDAASCTVINTNNLHLAGGWGYVGGPEPKGARSMFDLNSHEFGHCLGIGHVGDAGDFQTPSFPREDIMSYKQDGSQVHCVSNLNILALQALYADDLGQTAPPTHTDNPGPLEKTFVEMPRADYDHGSCSNPLGGRAPVLL